ncbi:unnamed protein product, partial [marine sediment metagenome]
YLNEGIKNIIILQENQIRASSASVDLTLRLVEILKKMEAGIM